jgi:hypothetical protein
MRLQQQRQNGNELADSKAPPANAKMYKTIGNI